MTIVTHHGHGVYCYKCQRVYPTASTDPDDEDTPHCEHSLSAKAGVMDCFSGDEYFAQPADLGHHGPHRFIEIDGMQQCVECDGVKIPAEMVE